MLSIKYRGSVIFLLFVLFVTMISCSKTKDQYETGLIPFSSSYFDQKITASDSLMAIGEFNQAINKLDEIYSPSKIHDTSLYIKILFRLGTSYSNLGLYAEALPYFQQGLDLSNNLNDSTLSLKFLANKGILYSKVSDTANALKIFRNLLDNYGSVRNSDSEIISLSPIMNSYGVIYKERNKLDSALVLFENALKDEKLTQHKAGIFNNIGTVYRLKGKYSYAHLYTDTAIRIARENNRQDMLMFYTCNKLRIFTLENKLGQAGLLIDSIELYYRDSYIWMVKKNYMETQIDYYSAIGNYKKALDLMNRYLKLESEEQKITRARRFFNILVQNEKRLKQEKIAELEADHKLDHLKLRNQRSAIVFAITLIILLSTLLMQIVKKHKKVNSLNKSLVQKNLELIKKESFKENVVIDRNDRELKGVEINEELRKTILEQLNRLEDNKELLRDPNLTVDKLARQFNTNQKYLSSIINDAYKCNFNSFINEKRIKESCRLFMQEKYLNYTIEGVATEVGFSNKATFNRAFKKYTQVTPSVFRQHCK